MSYLSRFKGTFEYPDLKTAESALAVIDQEAEEPDEFETNALVKDNFKLNSEKNTLTIDFSGFLASSAWYGSYRTLCKMSAHAIKGKIRCGFEGDPDEWVKYGRGWGK